MLFDQNLSQRLVTRFAKEFPHSTHVKLVGLASATDEQIWQHAKANGYTIISKDGDFTHLALLYGQPPKVVWLKVGNASTADIENHLRAHVEQIEVFERQTEEALLVIS